MCKRHYDNVRYYGHAIPIKERPMYERLALIGWTVTESGCWEWNGRRNELGYPLLGKRRVHRLMLADRLGRSLARDEVARHTCDNPPCVNPDHLLPGSQADNVADTVSRDRHKRWRDLSTCSYGHDLTLEGALRIHRNGNRVCLECARRRTQQHKERQLAGTRKALGL